MSEILGEGLKKELGEARDIVVDPSAGHAQPEPQKNQRQKHKEEKKNRGQVLKSNSKIKELKRAAARKLTLEKAKRRNETIAGFKQEKVPETIKDLIGKTSLIGTFKTDSQKYKEALENKAHGLPFDQEIIDKVDKKKEMAQKIMQMPLVIPPIDQEYEPPASERKIEPMIKPDVKIEPKPKVVVQNVHEAAPAINVLLKRPEGIDELRSKLPIIDKETEILEILNDQRGKPSGEEIEAKQSDILLICGETGSGKTTQVPQFLYEAGYGTIRSKGKIAITEPRRVATINMSKRVAHEMGFRHGAEVGYQIRHERLLTDATVIKFMTDGVLLRELESDLLLMNYSVIIIDEAHERTVNTDVLIGLLSKIVVSRRANNLKDPSKEPLKLIIMSATMRVQDFLSNKKLFEIPPPLIEVKGRMFPVNAQFATETPRPEDMNNAIKHLVDQLHEHLPSGSILVFVPGKQDINELVRHFRSLPTTEVKQKAIKNSTPEEEGKSKEEQPESSVSEEKPEDIENFDKMMTEGSMPKITSRKPMVVYPLYSLLDPIEQAKVFEDPPKDKRVIIFSTNVAETSLTIPGVRFVVDSGLEKVRVYDFTRGVVNAKVQYISQASAEQRMGRAGRTSPGYCFRLYSSSVYQYAFDQFSDPEILKRPIDEVILLLKAMGLNDIARFPFPTQISEEAINESEKILKHLSAIETTSPNRITALGRTLISFPLSPRLAKILILARSNNILNYAAIIVAALTVREPLEGEPSKELSTKYGDVIRVFIGFGGWLNESPQDREAFCKKMGLRSKAMEDMQSIRMQLSKILSKADVQLDTTALDVPQEIEMSRLCQAILGGYSENVAHRVKDLKYQTNDNKEAFLSGTSCLAENPPAFIVYSDLVDSEGKLKLQNPTRIHPSWLMYAGSPLYLTKGKPRLTLYNQEQDQVLSYVSGTFGNLQWNIPETPLPSDDPYRFFAAALLSGNVFDQLKPFTTEISAKLREDLANQIAPRQIPQRNMMIVSQLKKQSISTKKALLEKFNSEPSFLLTEYLYWVEESNVHTKIQSTWLRLRSTK